MFRVSLPLSALHDPSFTPQMQLDALELAYCHVFSLLDECDLPAAVDVELRRRLDALLAIALGINVTMMPSNQFVVTDVDGSQTSEGHERQPG